MIGSDPKSYNNPGRSTLVDSDIGHVGEALISVMRELWVVIDRVAVMEAVLAKRGIDISAEIEAFVPDEEMQARLNERGSRFVSNIVDALSGLSKD